MTTENILSLAHMDIIERVQEVAWGECSEYHTRRLFWQMIYDMITPYFRNEYTRAMWAIYAKCVISGMIELADCCLLDEEVP